jgi:predicted site-specific integrase-resolvase
MAVCGEILVSLDTQGRRLVVVDPSERDDDLVRDATEERRKMENVKKMNKK